MTDDPVVRLNRTLETLILVAAAGVGNGLSLAERAPLLARLGLERGQIARVCDSTPNAISVRLAEQKRRPKNGKGPRRRRKGNA